MNESLPAPRRLDTHAFEMILVVALITLHDFLLSDALSLPLALQRSTLAQLRALDRVVSSAEFLVPAIFIFAMVLLWLAQRNQWVMRLAIVFLAWVTLRLVAKVALVLLTIISRPVKQASGILTDTIVLWFALFLLFGIWYWMIDGGGPTARRDGTSRRIDFAFPQQAVKYIGWEDWMPGFWDYVFLGFCGSTQFSLGDATVLSLRAKLLLMIQVTLSVAVIVFIASIAIGIIR
jgi:hypothetical protein